MPAAIDPVMAVSTPGQPMPPMMGNRGFNIGNQKVGLDVDFANQRLKGWAEIQVIPTDAGLRQIRLNSRQCEITRCTVNNRVASQVKYTEPYGNFKIHNTATVNQHHMLRKKLEGVLHDPPEHELIITIPSKVKIEAPDPFSIAAQHALAARGNPAQPSRVTPDIPPPTAGAATPALTARPESMYAYQPLTVRIEYIVENIRDGFHFVGCEEGDMRYPHAYTTNSPLPGASCCLFPTLDGIHERWTWDIEITVPKTLNDISRTAASQPQTNGVANGVESHEDEMEEVEMAHDSGLDFVVVCSGDLTDEETHPTEPWKKVVKFTQGQAVAPQHISFAVGPFQQVNLSEFRDVENEEAMGTMSVDVLGYCLPRREAELRNTCMFLPKAIDFIVKEFGQYVFSAFKLCFVDDLATDTVESASLALCSTRLLFPENIIDPIWSVTRSLTYALTAQWAGVQVVPKDWADIWIVVGMAYWMTGCFLKNLMGNNEYRFRLKKDAQRICELDVGRPSLYAQGFQAPIEPSQLDFIKLKAPVVLTILEKRLWKLSSSMVLHRVVRKIFLSAVAGELKNGLMSTAHFSRLCEKHSHNKLESFFLQWVYGSGYPRFEISQRFNKKRMIVEMGIRQVQSVDPPVRRVTPEDFLKDARDHDRHVAIGPSQAVFTGPMTIRIHEADGTPYEHVVDIKEGYTKLDIPYNTKYKRLKRSRRQKERAAAGMGVDVSIDAQNDDVLLYCLGDVLQSEEEMDDWRLVDWSKEDEEKMSQESFEWIRMDADFEWICALNINQPDYMFLSQLQQDRDVIAQYDSIRHFASVRESALVSTILLRTVLDRRYYYGIRVEAALALAKCATAELDWIGQFHLMKAFQEFFCFTSSNIPKGNDFSDFTSYYVQMAIPQAMARIRNVSGVCPANVQKWLLDVLRYNDNSNNNFDDCYYVANLMGSLASTLSHSADSFDFDEEEAAAQNAAIAEIERCQRMDQWQPTYMNIISETALEVWKQLAFAGIKPADHRLFMTYAREGTLETLRLKAFGCLIDLGALRVPPLAEHICMVMSSDPSPYIRHHLQMMFGRGLGMIALGDQKMTSNAIAADDMIIDDGSGDGAGSRKAEVLAKETIEGAMAALKKELKDDELIKKAVWTATTSSDIGLVEMRYMLDICRILYEEKTSMIVILKSKKHLSCRHIGRGILHFKWSYGKPPPLSPPPPPPPAAATPVPRSMPIKLITNPKPRNVSSSGRKQKEPKPSIRRTPSASSISASAPSPFVPPPSVPATTAPPPPPPPQQAPRKIILKIKPSSLQQSVPKSSQPNGTS